MSGIQLLPCQQDHVDKLMQILNVQQFAFDLSIMGSGKTYTSSHIAHLRSLKHVIVVCPASVCPKWNAMKKNNPDINFHTICSFQSLRSTKLHQPSHGLLYRREQQSELNPMLNKMADFQATPLYLDLVKDGVLLIIDEIQNIKNVTIQLFAVRTLTHEILKDGPSKMLLLSASPIDKINQAVEVFRGLGVLRRPLTQYNPAIASNVWTGLRDIHTFCLAINPESTRAVQARQYYEAVYDNYVYRLFQGVLVKHCSSSMVQVKHVARLTKANAYYVVDKEGEEILKRGMHVLTTASGFDGRQVLWDAQRISSISRALQVIETGKIQTLVRVAREHLHVHPQAKVVIAVNYSETLKDLRHSLAEYNPLTLEGCTSQAGRAKCLELFAVPSTEHRLLLCNQGVASTGIDLDDKDGNFPRLCLVNPTYSSIIAFQLGHRFLRMDTKSNATVHFVFALRQGAHEPSECGDIVELKVLDALSRKSSVMRETSGMEVDVQYPGEHDEFIEDVMT
jgi:hypothetical protein